MHTEPAAVATELVQRKELAAVLKALDDGGIRILLFKGAALAFTHYAYSSDRPRLDADLLVAPAQRQAAAQVLERLGYRPPPRIPGSLIQSQAVFEKTDELGVAHTIDLHWHISKPQIFAHLFPFDELAAAAVPVPALGPAARAPRAVHALAIACVHRVAHHHGPDRDRPMWLTDIHLLASRLTPGEAAEFVAYAERHRIVRICADALTSAERAIGRALPEPLAQLRAKAANVPREPTAAYLEPKMRRVDVLVNDLAALPSWRTRAQLLFEHVFPPRSYMQGTYGVKQPGVLPVLYLWRILRGAAGWFRVERSR